jgi:hypothetical protein
MRPFQDLSAVPVRYVAALELNILAIRKWPHAGSPLRVKGFPNPHMADPGQKQTTRCEKTRTGAEMSYCTGNVSLANGSQMLG